MAKLSVGSIFLRKVKNNRFAKFTNQAYDKLVVCRMELNEYIQVINLVGHVELMPITFLYNFWKIHG